MAGLWERQLLPRLLDVGMRGGMLRELRAHTVPAARGRVLEIGFGGGLNLPFYGPAVSEVLALEPNEVARRIARRRAEHSPIPVRFVGLRGEEIPLDSGSVDAVVSTFTMCTIPDLSRALAELRRVLVPGGQLHFLEHGLAQDESVARWQRRLTPIQRRLFGGCRLDRDVTGEVRRAGFAFDECERFDAARPHALAHIHRGRARPN